MQPATRAGGAWPRAGEVVSDPSEVGRLERQLPWPGAEMEMVGRIQDGAERNREEFGGPLSAEGGEGGGIWGDTGGGQGTWPWKPQQGSGM